MGPFRKILVVLKRTKYELDLAHFYFDSEILNKIYSLQNNTKDRVIESHNRQINARKQLKEFLGNESYFIFREEIESINTTDYDLVISLGGDNHFTFVAHKTFENLIIGCNSDKETSVGALLGYNPDSLIQEIQNQWKNSEIQEWILLTSKIQYPDGRLVETLPAVGEISIRNNNPDLTSRYIIQYESDSEEQKSSGLLLYNGAGSTGWVASCNPRKFGSFPKNSDYFAVYSREIRHKDPNEKSLLYDFKLKDKVTITSLMNGGLSIDSLSERTYPFPPGSKVEVSISPKRLKVLMPNPKA
jgi:NAD kinase